MKIRTNITLALSAIAGLTITANAASIAVNMGSDIPANTLAPADVAGVIPQGNWNNKLGNSGASTQVTDDSGTLLATVAANSTQWSNGGATVPGTANGILLNGGLDGGGNTTLSIAFSNVPYTLYDIYVYHGTPGNSTRSGTYTVDDGNVSIAKVGSDVGSFSGTFVEDTGAGGDYLLFSGLTGANVSISARPLPSNNVPRAPIRGVQIVDAAVAAIPEPSTAVLSALGLVGFLIRRKR